MQLLFICTLVVLPVFILTIVAIFRGRQRDRLQQASIQWQVKRFHRRADGWKPTLWDPNDPTVTEREKALAWKAYAEGKPIPLSGREAHRG